MWSTCSNWPLSLTSGDHAGDKPSTNYSKVHGKGKVKFPYTLCERNHPIHIFPYMDEASKVLECLTSSQQQLSTSYQNLSPNPPLADEVINPNPYLVNPTLFERESHEFVPDQPLVGKMVDLTPPLIYLTFPIESKVHTAQVLLISSSSNELGGNPPVPSR